MPTDSSKLSIKKHPKNGLYYVVREDGVIASIEASLAEAQAFKAKAEI